MAKAQILIVEDDNIVVLELRDRLQSLGYAVCAVVSYGEEAIAKAEEMRPDLVLMDIRLRGAVNGIDAAKGIRERLDIPVVYLTAYADEDTLQRAKLTEPYGYIIKPFQERELHTVIEVALYKYKVEEALRESEEKLRILFEQLPIGVSLLDQNRKMIYANPALAKILDISREDLLQGKYQNRQYIRPDGTLMPPEEYASVRAFREQQPVRDVEIGVITESGKTIWTSVSAAPFPMADKGVVIATVDITERKRAEEALKEYSERLEEMVKERTKELRDAQARLIQSERLAAIGRLAASVAHEINNPLQGISNYLSLISQQVAQDDPLHENLGMVKLGFERVAEIVRRLRAFYRPVGEGMEPTGINGVVERALALVGHQLSLGKIKMKTELAEQELPVLGSVGQLEQVLVNLALNAQEAMPEGGELTVRTTLNADVVQLQVADTGRGINEEEMGRLFKPFYGGSGGKGLGLGLWISHNIIEGHGGSIEVESQVGEGTTFIISLPAYQRER